MRRSLLARVICIKSSSVRKNGHPRYISRRVSSFDSSRANEPSRAAAHVQRRQLADGGGLREERQEVLVLVDQRPVRLLCGCGELLHSLRPPGPRGGGGRVG